MSKRAETREKLARKLSEGLISQQLYDERMARLNGRGKESQTKHRIATGRIKPPAPPPREWRPGHEKPNL